MVIGVTRVLSAILIAILLAVSGQAMSEGAAAADGVAAPPAAASGTLWDSLRTGAFGVLEYGSQVMRSVTGWLFTSGGEGDEAKAEDIRGLLSLSDKEFREFELLIRAAGYVLQGYSFGVDGGSEVELVFDFERVISDRERAELRRQLEQQNGGVNAARREIILGLLDTTRYVDASPASGYRLAGMTMRLSSPPDVRIRFRRTKP